MLEAQRKLDGIDVEFHSKWIKNLWVGGGGFRSPYGKEATLEDTFYGIFCLSILRDFEGIQKADLSKWLLEKWRCSRRDPQSTFYLLSSLDSIGHLCQGLKDELTRSWLYPRLPVLLNIRLDKNSETVYYLVSIYHLLGGEPWLLSDKVLSIVQHRVAENVKSLQKMI
jgi:prenyltransferase beta subunit